MLNWFKKKILSATAERRPVADTVHGGVPVAQSPANVSEALKQAGDRLMGEGKLEGAADCYRRAIEHDPHYAEAHVNLGNVSLAQGNVGEAIALYRKALMLNPGLLPAHQNLGIALMNAGQGDAAEESFRRVIALAPDNSFAIHSMGVIAARREDFQRAETLLRQAIRLQPEYAEAHCNLGNVLLDTHRPQEAEASCRRALQLNPESAEAHFGLGNVLTDLRRLDEATASFRRALELNPGFAEACNNLGHLFKRMGRLDDAVACYRRGMALAPDDTVIHSNLVYLLCFHPSCAGQDIVAEARRFAAAHRVHGVPASGGRDRDGGAPDRRLRIGYVSPDFRDHCQSLFTVPLLSHHDHAQFEIYCYAQLTRPDAISKRLAGYADVWRLTNGISDLQLAEMIAADDIDILVDLTMHMSGGRPLLFAYKPAPVQVAWLAYPGTTGIPEIDYRFTDPWLDPPETGDDCYTERSIRLPDTFWCYDPLTSDLQPNALPAQAAGHVTFGCLNNFCKVSDDTLSRWGQIMARVPSSRLLLLADPGSHRQRVLALLGGYGVDAQRIEFIEPQPRRDYLKTYHRIDLCLDTLPYNGHTTSLDAYWMGVPVVTQVGKTVVGRAGWSQLNNLGLTELVAFDGQTFVDIAVALANDLPRLSQLRRTLRPRMEGSALMDGARFARAIEAAYRQIGPRPSAGLSER